MVQTVFQLTFSKNIPKLTVSQSLNSFQSFVTGIFPEPLKVISVILIFKKADHLECTNYQLISLTSSISKTLEKLVHKCLYYFLDKNEILFNNQIVSEIIIQLPMQ